MAKNVGTAFVDIRADTTKFESELKSSLGSSLKTAGDQAKKFGRTTNESLLSVSKSMTNVGKDLTKKVTLPLVGIGVGALLTAGNFEAGMNKVRAITGGTEVDIKGLSDQAKELGSSTKFSATEAANAMAFLGMAGFDTTQIMGAMPGTLQLAAAANMGLAEAADITSNVLSGFGIAVDDLGSVNDALVKTLTRTNTDLSQLGQAFKFVGPVAKGAGVSFNETAAAIGLLGNAGIQAGMAGTSLRGAISALINPSKQVSDTMAQLGMNVLDSSGNMLPLNQIIQQLEESGASTGVMMQLFGQRAGPAMMALVEQGSDALRDLTTELDNSGGTAETIANIQMEGFNGAMTELKSAVEGFMIALGESGLLKAMTGFSKFVSNAFRALSNLNPIFMTTIAVTGALAAAMGPLLIVSGSVIRNFVLLRQTLVGTRAAKIAATIAAHGLRAAMVSIPLVAVATGLLMFFNRMNNARNAAKDFAAGVQDIADRMGQGEQATDLVTSKLKEFVDESPRTREALAQVSFSFKDFADAAINDADRFGEMTAELNAKVAENLGSISGHAVADSATWRKWFEERDEQLLMLQQGLAAGADAAADWAAINERELQFAADAYTTFGDMSVESLLLAMDAAERTALGSEAALGAMTEAAEVAAFVIETELANVQKAADDLASGVDQSARSAADSFLRLSDEGKQDIDTFVNDMIDGAARLSLFQDNIGTIAGATSAEFANHMMAMGVDVQDLVSDLADPRKAADLERAFNAFELQSEIGARNMSEKFAEVDPKFKKTLEGIAGLTTVEMDNIKRIAEEKAVEVGTALMLGQVEGITVNSPAVQVAVRSAVNDAITAALREAGIESPSRRMADEVGRPMSEGVAVGIEEGSDDIDAALRRTIQESLINAAKDLDRRIAGLSESASGSFLDNLIPSDDDLAEIPRIVDEVTGEIKQLGRAALSAGDEFVKNLVDASGRLDKFQNNVVKIAEQTSGEFGLHLLEMGEKGEQVINDLADPAKELTLRQAYAAWRNSTEVTSKDMVAKFAQVDPGFAEVLKGLEITIEEETKPIIETAKRNGSSAGSGLVRSASDGIHRELPGLRARRDEMDAVLSRPLPRPVGQPTLAVPPSFSDGLFGQGSGGPLLNIQNAQFNNGIGTEALVQQLIAAGVGRFG